MNDSRDRLLSEETNTTQPDSREGKKAYEKPQVIYRAPLEAMAGLCAKADDVMCEAGPIQS